MKYCVYSLEAFIYLKIPCAWHTTKWKEDYEYFTDSSNKSIKALKFLYESLTYNFNNVNIVVHFGKKFI